MTQDSVWCVDLHTMILMGWRFAVSVECVAFLFVSFFGETNLKLVVRSYSSYVASKYV